MGEAVDIDYDSDASPATAGEDSGDCVHEWEAGLPTADDLTPLSQSLIPRELAAAFSISPEPSRTLLDVHRASRSTLISLRRQTNGNSSSSSSSPVKFFRPFPGEPERLAVEAVEEPPASKDQASGSDSPGKVGEPEDTIPMEDVDSAAQMENSVDENSGRSSKRPRLVWTPQLHKRFVDVVSHLGLNNAVPKTIMQLMNVEGLTRENVASHLQKYRLYVKRMQGLPDEGPSASDQLFASASVPQNVREAPVPPRVPIPVPVPYAAPSGVIPMIGIASHGHGGMLPANGHPGAGPSYPRFELHRPHTVFGERPREWPRGNKFSRPHVASPTDK